MSELMNMIKRDIKHFYYSKVQKLNENEIEVLRLRKIGMKVGGECYIFSKKIETPEPYLVAIGDHVTIAIDVTFITHDASANFYLENTSDIYGRIDIGNYCFIGAGSIILPGVKIADHTIVAAGSVVTKSILEEGWVVGGNPIRKIEKIEKLKEKNVDKKLMTWGMSFEDKKRYLLDNEDLFKMS